jgi:hypothetical protein
MTHEEAVEKLRAEMPKDVSWFLKKFVSDGSDPNARCTRWVLDIVRDEPWCTRDWDSLADHSLFDAVSAAIATAKGWVEGES